MSDALAVPRGSIWLPGKGVTPINRPDERAACKAVEEYDPDYTLAQRKDTGEWLVVLRNGPQGSPFPVLGFGTQLPSPEKVKERLYKADVKRHGAKVAQQVQEHNERLQAEKEKEFERRNEEMAEVLIDGLRHQGYFPRSLPNKHPKNRPYRRKEG